MGNMDTFKPDRDESDIGVMMMMDALISSGYYVVWGSKHLDRELCSDIVAYKVDDENIECWRNGNPRPTGIDVKYVTNGPIKYGNMFFEIDSNREKYLGKEGWGRYRQGYYFQSPNWEKLMYSWNEGNEIVIRIAYVQRDEEIDKQARKARTLEERIEIYKQMRAGVSRQPIIIAPLYFMQSYDEDNKDPAASENYFSRLKRKDNGLLMPLDDFKKYYAYEKMTWNAVAGKWNTEIYGRVKIPRNKPGSEKLENMRPLLDLYQEQLDDMNNGRLNYQHLLDVDYLNRDMEKTIQELKMKIQESHLKLMNDASNRV